MRVNIDLNMVLTPLVIITNVGVNSLTKLYYSCLNPRWDMVRKTSSAATFHYNFKASPYNLATAYLGYKLLRAVLGKESLPSIIINVSLMLLIRAILDRSMYVHKNAKTMIKGACSLVKGTESLEEISMFDTGFAAICLTASKGQSLLNNRTWAENMLTIQGYPILKNWA